MIVVWICLSTLVGLVAILFLLYLLVFVRPCARQPKDASLLCDYAHRGLHGGGVPENSLAAFSRACEEGVGIELDVQLSRDGEVMVFHDATLVRMTGEDKLLCDLTAAELKELRLAESEEQIPSFREVLSLVNGRVPLLVELKGENLNLALCEPVAKLLLDYQGSYCIESFNPFLIREMKKYLPEAFYGQLFTNICREKKKRSLVNFLLSCMAFNFLAKPNFIAYNEQYRRSFAVRLTTKFYRAPRFVWTVRSEEKIALARTLSEHPIFERK